MAGEPVVFDGVWKKFSRGERHDSLRDLVPALARRMLGRGHPAELEGKQEFWAVRDVSFDVKRGSALGIIGPNGAGKSTILKLLTKILRPTRGTCTVRGRVGALIEVSAGFHSDLTGRENIYLQGAIMGMRRAEIARTFDAIVDFSGVSEFIDTPVKRYSSGMNAKLGFSIAAHLDPEVLIIDEVLAVGDAAFQQRCFERIKSMRAKGTTLVFVSHNLPAVESLCDTTLVLWQGKPLFMGNPHEATSAYLHPPDTTLAAPSGALRPDQRWGNQAVTIASVRVLGPSGAPVSHLRSGSAVEIEVALVGGKATEDVVVGFAVADASRVTMFGENGSVKIRPFALQAGETATCRIRIESLALPEGRYYLTVAAHAAVNEEVFDWHDRAYPLDIDVPRDTTRTGHVGFLTQWTLVRP